MNNETFTARPETTAAFAPSSWSEGGLILFMDNKQYELDLKPQEQWRSIDGYEGMYEVSSLGRVRSLARKDSVGRTLPDKMLALPVNKPGYKLVGLCKNGVPIKKQVGRLVAYAFIPNPLSLPQVNHKSGIKTDDSVTNLEWVTSAENMEHAKRIGLNKNFCETSPCASMSNADVLEIRRRYRPFKVTGAMLAAEFGRSRSYIYQIVSRRVWKRI